MAKKSFFQNKSLKDLPGERWKPVPGWEHYEVSNLGRVKSLGRWVEQDVIAGKAMTRKEIYKPEKILSQWVRVVESDFNNDAQRYLCFNVYSDNHSKSFRTARLVYFLFIKKYLLGDIKKIIRYKDGNGLNILPENLVLSNNSEKMRFIVANSRSPRLKMVTQYTLTGKKIKTFPTIKEASRSVKGQPSRIFTVLDKWPHYYKGFLWRKGNKQKVRALKKLLINHPKKVIQYSMQGKKVKMFVSLTKAAQAVDAGNSNLRKALKGKCKTCKGYKWVWG